MDLKLVVLGMVFVVVLVMMGDNPFYVPEEYKRDPFRYKIEKKLADEEKKKGTFGFDSPSLDGSGGFTSSVTGAAAPGGTGAAATPYGVNTGAYPMNPSDYPSPTGSNTPTSVPILVPGPGGGGYVAQEQNLTNLQQFQLRVERAQNQAKPGAANTQAATAAAAAAAVATQPNVGIGQNPPQADGAPAYFLKDGRRIFFSGYKVFFLLADGQIQSLPDGVHEMSGGEKIVIRNGKRKNIR